MTRLGDYEIEEGKGKGRKFRARLVAAVQAKGLFEADNQDPFRPVFALWAGTDGALRPFVANLRAGRKAEPPGYGTKPEDRVEFVRSAEYEVYWQREEEGSLATFWLPELFRLDPGMPSEELKFVALVPRGWTEKNSDPAVAARALEHALPRLRGDPEVERAARLAPYASLFAAYVDRRTRCPILPDPRFHLRLLLACLAADQATEPAELEKWGRATHGFKAGGLEDCGFALALAFRADREEFEELLKAETRGFMNAAGTSLTATHR